MTQQRAPGQRAMQSKQGNVVCSGNEIPHKCRRILATKLAILIFLKTLKHKAIHLQVDNVVALTYLLKMEEGGYPEFKISLTSKRNMGSSFPIWDHSYCRVLVN